MSQPAYRIILPYAPLAVSIPGTSFVILQLQHISSPVGPGGGNRHFQECLVFSVEEGEVHWYELETEANAQDTVKEAICARRAHRNKKLTLAADSLYSYSHGKIYLKEKHLPLDNVRSISTQNPRGLGTVQARNDRPPANQKGSRGSEDNSIGHHGKEEYVRPASSTRKRGRDGSPEAAPSTSRADATGNPPKRARQEEVEPFKTLPPSPARAIEVQHAVEHSASSKWRPANFTAVAVAPRQTSAHPFLPSIVAGSPTPSPSQRGNIPVPSPNMKPVGAAPHVSDVQPPLSSRTGAFQEVAQSHLRDAGRSRPTEPPSTNTRDPRVWDSYKLQSQRSAESACAPNVVATSTTMNMPPACDGQLGAASTADSTSLPPISALLKASEGGKVSPIPRAMRTGSTDVTAALVSSVQEVGSERIIDDSSAGRTAPNVPRSTDGSIISDKFKLLAENIARASVALQKKVDSEKRELDMQRMLTAFSRATPVPTLSTNNGTGEVRRHLQEAKDEVQRSHNEADKSLVAAQALLFELLGDRNTILPTVERGSPSERLRESTNARATGMEEELDDLKTRMTTTEGDLHGVRAEQTRSKDRVDGLQATTDKVSGLHATVEELEESVGSKMAILEQKLNALERAGAEDARLTKMESELDQMKKEKELYKGKFEDARSELAEIKQKQEELLVHAQSDPTGPSPDDLYIFVRDRLLPQVQDTLAVAVTRSQAETNAHIHAAVAGVRTRLQPMATIADQMSRMLNEFVQTNGDEQRNG